jgi:hypothetical protein
MPVEGLQFRVGRPSLSAAALADQTKLAARLTGVVHNFRTRGLAIHGFRGTEDDTDPNEIIPGSGGACALCPAGLIALRNCPAGLASSIPARKS